MTATSHDTNTPAGLYAYTIERVTEWAATAPTAELDRVAAYIDAHPAKNTLNAAADRANRDAIHAERVRRAEAGNVTPEERAEARRQMAAYHDDIARQYRARARWQNDHDAEQSTLLAENHERSAKDLRRAS